MATKVTVIDVDLGVSVDDIISEEIKELTGVAHKELDRAIDAAKTVIRVREEKEAATNAAIENITAAMDTAHDMLAAAGTDGVTVAKIMQTVEGVIPNASAFTLRMKKILANKGNLYRLERAKINGEHHYLFIPFNIDDQKSSPGT